MNNNKTGSIIRVIRISIVVMLTTYNSLWSQDIKINLIEPLLIDNFNFYVDTVYIAQLEQQVVGYHWSNGSAASYKFKKAKNISKGLQKLFDKSFPNENGKKPLSVRINKIHYTTDEFTETVDFILHLSFITSDANQYYHLYTTSHTNFKPNVQMDRSVFLLSEKMLHEGLTCCFNEFMNNLDRFDMSLINIEQLTDASILFKTELDRLEIKNQSDPRCFNHFNDFVMNYGFKDEQLLLERIEYEKHDFYYRPVVQDDIEINEYWMIYDGSNYFVNFESNYYKLNTVDNNRVEFTVPVTVQKKEWISGLLGITASIASGPYLRKNTDFDIVTNVIIGATVGTVVYYLSSAIIKQFSNIEKTVGMVYELDLLTGIYFRKK